MTNILAVTQDTKDLLVVVALILAIICALIWIVRR